MDLKHRNLFSLVIIRKPLDEIQEVKYYQEIDDYGFKDSKVLLIFNSGEEINLKIAGSSSNLIQTVQSLNQFLGLTPKTNI